MNIPEAKVVRISGKGKGQKYYVVKCPYCECQHYHDVRGGLGNRGRHCLDLGWMSKRGRTLFPINQARYPNCSTYDIVL